MSRRVSHVLAAFLVMMSQTVTPLLAADTSQVNFKIFSPPASGSADSTQAEGSPAAESSGTESMWTDGDAGSQAPPGSQTTETPEPSAESTGTTSETEPVNKTTDLSSGMETPQTDTADTASTSQSTEEGAGGENKVLQGYIRVVPSGTKVPIIMDSAVDSDTSQEGDEFAARTAEDLTIDGSTCVPAGSVIKGRIARLNAPKHLNRSGSVALKFDTITTPDNKQIPLSATLVARGGVVHAKRGLKDLAIDTGTFVAPAALGTVIGAIAGGASSSSSVGTAGGLLIGAGIGVAIGTVILCAKKGKRVDVRPGDELKIELAEDLRMPM